MNGVQHLYHTVTYSPPLLCRNARFRPGSSRASGSRVLEQQLTHLINDILYIFKNKIQTDIQVKDYFHRFLNLQCARDNNFKLLILLSLEGW